MSKVTTTAYSMLGLLSLRAWSTYELAQHMLRSNLRAIWPRAESRIYEEPKRLTREGLAEAEVLWRGGRRRTVYTITRRGRDALRRWLGQPSRRFSFRSEAAFSLRASTSGAG